MKIEDIFKISAWLQKAQDNRTFDLGTSTK